MEEKKDESQESFEKILRKLGLWTETDEKVVNFAEEMKDRQADMLMESSLIADFVFFVSLIYLERLVSDAENPKHALNEIMLSWRERIAYAIEKQFQPFKKMIEDAEGNEEMEKYIGPMHGKIMRVRECYARSVRKIAADVERLIFEKREKENEEDEIL